MPGGAVDVPDGGERGPRRGDDRVPRVGQRETPPASAEERDVVLPLEVVQRPRDDGLRYPLGAGRAAHRARVGSRHQIAQLLKIHVQML